MKTTQTIDYSEAKQIIDRIVEKAGVAKATLYTLFGSKDGLVRAYLTARHDHTRERMTRAGFRYIGLAG